MFFYLFLFCFFIKRIFNFQMMIKHVARAALSRDIFKNAPCGPNRAGVDFSCIRVRDRTIKRVPGAIGVEVEMLFVKYVSYGRTDGRIDK